MVIHVLSCVQLFATLQTVAHQAPLPIGFSSQEYWSGLPFSPPGDLPDPRDGTRITCTAEGFFFNCWATCEVQCNSSVQFGHSVMSDFLQPHELQHARPPCPSPTPGVDSNQEPRILPNNKRVILWRRCNNPKCVSTKYWSFKIHDQKLTELKGENRQIHSTVGNGTELNDIKEWDLTDINPDTPSRNRRLYFLFMQICNIHQNRSHSGE